MSLPLVISKETLKKGIGSYFYTEAKNAANVQKVRGQARGGHAIHRTFWGYLFRSQLAAKVHNLRLGLHDLKLRVLHGCDAVVFGVCIPKNSPLSYQAFYTWLRCRCFRCTSKFPAFVPCFLYTHRSLLAIRDVPTCCPSFRRALDLTDLKSVPR